MESPRLPTGSSLPKFGNAYMSSAPGGIIYKNVMAKTRREKGKESELQVSAINISSGKISQILRSDYIVSRVPFATTTWSSVFNAVFDFLGGK